MSHVGEETPLSVMLAGIAIAITFLSMAVAGWAIYTSAQSQKKSDRAICLAFNEENLIIRHQLQRAKVSLPHLSYYRNHPLELRVALDTIEDELVSFKQRVC